MSTQVFSNTGSNGAPLLGVADLRCFTIESEGRTFGLPVESVQTVFEMTAVTPVPLAASTILGLVNLRGKIVTAISLRRRLNKGTAVAEPSKLAVGLNYRGENYALVIDAVGDVIALDAESGIGIPAYLGQDGAKFSSVHRLDHLILPMLDLSWLFAFDRTA